MQKGGEGDQLNNKKDQKQTTGFGKMEVSMTETKELSLVWWVNLLNSGGLKR